MFGEVWGRKKFITLVLYLISDLVYMLYVALAILFLAILFFWQSNRQRQAAGLPGGRVIYTDTRGWGKL